MQPGQRLIASDGYEVALIPLAIMGVTAGEHAGNQLAMDFGYAGDLYPSGEMPYYAPVSCTCVAIYSDYIIWRSNDLVHTPIGLSYLSWQFGHDNHLSDHYVGQVMTQGDLIGYTGNNGLASGYHLHLSAINGYTYNYVGNHLYNLFYVNNTEIRRTGGYTWETYSQPTPTTHIVTLYTSPTNAGYTTGQGEYNDEEEATLSAFAYKGYQFTRWSDGYQYTPRYWTITSDLTLTAYFDEAPTERGVPLFNYDGTDISIR